MTVAIRVKMFRAVNKSVIESGCCTPNNEENSFMTSPMNKREAMLRPTEKKIVSAISRLFALNKLMITMPGINVRLRNTITCLTIGTFNKVTAVATNWKSRIDDMKFTCFKAIHFLEISRAYKHSHFKRFWNIYSYGARIPNVY